METRVEGYACPREEGCDNTAGPSLELPRVTQDVETGQVAVQPAPGNVAGRLGEGKSGVVHRPLRCCPHWAVILMAITVGCVSLAILIPVTMLINDYTFRHRKLTAAPPPSSTGGLGNLHRTAFHFQPERNWMNDPNGPMHYNGFYHLFYQYNPFAAVWGNITWGHAVSPDLIHWSYLPLALEPDQWYDANGVWSGSATLHLGTPVLAYTGSSNSTAQMQNLAYPANLSDPYLREWTKAEFNPIARAPAGVSGRDFRDPTTAWVGTDGVWRLVVGARRHGVELALVYRSTDFRNWTLREQPMRTAVAREGMWECPDFFPVSTLSQNGLDTSSNGLGVRHVLKGSFDDSRNDYYAVGTYNETNNSWSPVDPALDVETGLRYDYGRYYASKTFFDSVKQRRILLGWVNESDTREEDVRKGWASVQAIPRTLWVDQSTGKHLIQLPIEEVEGLRGRHVSAADVELLSGDAVEVSGAAGAQLDVEVSFELPQPAAPNRQEAENLLESGALHPELCSPRGAAQNGAVGPFGIAVLSSSDLLELTPIYFEMVPLAVGGWAARACSDQSRSSLTAGSDRSVYGYSVRVLPSDTALSLRVLVDRSIVETFAQGGKTVMTARVYPTEAIGDASRLFLFNNGSMPVKLIAVDAWQMSTVAINHI